MSDKQSLVASFFHVGFMLSLFSYLKMEAIYSTKTSVDFQWTIQPYIPENGTLHKVYHKLVLLIVYPNLKVNLVENVI
jgi:hypothetical protein